MFKLAALLAVSAATVSVKAGIDIWRVAACPIADQGPNTCVQNAYPLPWYHDKCDGQSPYTTAQSFQPIDLAYGGFPSHFFHPGGGPETCYSGPLDFYDTGDGYDVYYSGGDGTLLGHCSWANEGINVCANSASTHKLYTCDIPVCR